MTKLHQNCKHYKRLKTDCIKAGCDYHNHSKWEPKEEPMKDTITLRELIEQDACKEGVLWFLDEIISSTTYVTSLRGVVGLLKAENKKTYIDWLRDHGYRVDDKSEEIAEIKAEMKKLQDRLDEIDK